MKRRVFLITCLTLLGAVAVPPAYGEKKKNNNKKKSNTDTAKAKAKAKAAQKKMLKAEVDRVSRNLNLVIQERDRAVAELSEAESEVEQLKSQLGSVEDDSPDKTALSRKIHTAVARVKKIKTAIDQSDALMAKGRTYLAQLESQYAKMGGKKKQKK